MSVSEHVYALTSHCCRVCMGRLLVRVADGGKVFRCANCGLEATGEPGLAHPAICMCSARLGGRDAFLRCVPNPNPRPELLSEIVVREAA